MSSKLPSAGDRSVRKAEGAAAVAGAMADVRRVRMLSLLRVAPATVNEVAASLELRASEASLQLTRLRAVGLVRVVRSGRHRIYSADPDRISRLLEALTGDGELSGNVTGARLRRRLPPPELRQARTCYDHLAGATAVELADRLVGLRWLVRGRYDFLLTEKGEHQLVRRGVDVAACREARRRLAPGCLDWSERRPHIGGALGSALLRSLESAGFLTVERHRKVRSRRPILDWLRPGYPDRGGRDSPLTRRDRLRRSVDSARPDAGGTLPSHF